MTFRGVIPNVFHRAAQADACIPAESRISFLASTSPTGTFPQVHSLFSHSEGMVVASLNSLLFQLSLLGSSTDATSSEGTKFLDDGFGGDQVDGGFGGEPRAVPCQSYSLAGIPAWLTFPEDLSTQGWLSLVDEIAPYGVASPCVAIDSYGHIRTPGRSLSVSRDWMTGSYSSTLPYVEHLSEEGAYGAYPSGDYLMNASPRLESPLGASPYGGSYDAYSVDGGTSVGGGR